MHGPCDIIMRSLPHYLNITGNDNLVRDTHSMGVLNVNSHALLEAQKRKEEAMIRLAAQRHQESDLNTMRKEVAELKALVYKLLLKREE